MIRKAAIADAKKIHALIADWAKKGKVLDRSLTYIYENLRDFWIYEADKKIIGCCALHIVGWENLGEIKSLVVAESHHKKGIGTTLVDKCLQEAAELGMKSVFALTFVPQFFKKQGFKKIDRKQLPHKIWSDCVHCVYFPDCKEQAVLYAIRSPNAITAKE